MTDRDLQKLVDHYIEVHRPRFRTNRKRYREMPNFAMAVESAALARTVDGKCESHQRRVGIARLRRFYDQLAKRLDDLRACSSFDELHGHIAECRVPGVGTLAVYDTAVRIGWHRRLEPRSVYLHAGTRTGARALGVVSQHSISPEDMPEPLHPLSASELEDFLCMFAEAISGRESVREVTCNKAAIMRANCQGCLPRSRRSIC